MHKYTSELRADELGISVTLTTMGVCHTYTLSKLTN
jgi:hypothetical protein